MPSGADPVHPIPNFCTFDPQMAGMTGIIFRNSHQVRINCEQMKEEIPEIRIIEGGSNGK